MIRIAYEGTAHASSQVKPGKEWRLAAFDGLGMGSVPGWGGTSLPASVWFHFSKPHRLAKIAFSSFSNIYAPIHFRVVGSSDCANWTTLLDVKDTDFAGNNDPANVKNDRSGVERSWTIPKKNRRKFPCIGLIVTEAWRWRGVSVRGMKMWEEII